MMLYRKSLESEELGLKTGVENSFHLLNEKLFEKLKLFNRRNEVSILFKVCFKNSHKALYSTRTMNYVTTAPVNEKGTEQESIQTRNNLNVCIIHILCDSRLCFSLQIDTMLLDTHVVCHII